MKKWILLGLICLVPLLAQAEIYQWTKQDGTTVFSDTPHQGAKTVDLPPAQTYSSQDSLAGVVQKTSSPKSAQPAVRKNPYSDLEIVVPEDEATLRDNAGNMSVAVTYEPALEPGDSLVLMLDGRVKEKITQGSAFHLTNVDRGTHKLQAKIMDKKGNTLLSSATITFYMHQTVVRPVH